MKTFKTAFLSASFVLCSLLLSSWMIFDEPSVSNSPDNAIILLKFKAQPEKSDLAVSELKKLFEHVKNEPNYVSITLHVDPNDPTNILLYEEWEDLAYYNGEHMNTDHLKAFMANSANFLAGPPDISVWKVKGVFKK